ncbi:MAG: NADH:flavin oxidoreductase/NADH oxidase family protein [Actinobacteria bacterium]|nr:NADH:flavin oxidoreductase/NADH oxidase family protein [Actinomycetota bacterium]
MPPSLSAPITLPCGAILPNRLAKAATSEGLADTDNHSTPRLDTLYRRWSGSGVGLLFTGNIQVDRFHLERPGNIVVDDESGRAPLARLAAAGRETGTQFWAQLSHTGRQVSNHINPAPLSSSDVEIDAIRGTGLTFGVPAPMSENQIRCVTHQFGFAAAEVKRAGFTGVIVHAAHGYLISQFLSPRTNHRTDRWGGSLQNRSRLLIEIIASIRDAVGPRYPIGIKLNASDFQKGGFSHAECVKLVRLLNGSGLDLLELSGGSLEQPKVVGATVKDEGEDGPRAGTIAREAYFVEFAGAIRQDANMPLMVTGGFRSADAMSDALQSGDLDVIGVARPVIAVPESPRQLLSGAIDRLPAPEAGLDLLNILPWNNIQIERLADGLDPDLDLAGAEAAQLFTDIEHRYMNALLSHRMRTGQIPASAISGDSAVVACIGRGVTF